MNPNMNMPHNNMHMQPGMIKTPSMNMKPNMNSGMNTNIKPSIPSKCTLMNLIYEVGFSLDDILLYLDTHPKDMTALKYYQRLKSEYQELTHLYATHYGPLWAKDVYNDKYYSWVNKPMPWEGDM